MHPILERQLEELKSREIDFQLEPVPGSDAFAVSIPDLKLPGGWSQSQTRVRFVLPAGYPFAAPDCFWADPNLLLANGQPPQSSNQQPFPPTGEQGTWFSWHVAQWNPNRDSVLGFLRLIERRFQHLQ